MCRLLLAAPGFVRARIQSRPDAGVAARVRVIELSDTCSLTLVALPVQHPPRQVDFERQRLLAYAAATHGCKLHQEAQPFQSQARDPGPRLGALLPLTPPSAEACMTL